VQTTKDTVREIINQGEPECCVLVLWSTDLVVNNNIAFEELVQRWNCFGFSEQFDLLSLLHEMLLYLCSATVILEYPNNIFNLIVRKCSKVHPN
jgi:hypothetical protein